MKKNTRGNVNLSVLHLLALELPYLLAGLEPQQYRLS